jgi:hypothetical protein
MKNILLLFSPSDKSMSKSLAAQLRALLDLEKFAVVSPDSRDAYNDSLTQLSEAIKNAFAILVVVGVNGVELELEKFARGLIQQKIVDDGTRVARLRLHFYPNAEPPQWLKPWVPIEASDCHAMAEEILEKLKIKPLLSKDLALDRAAEVFDEKNRREVHKHLSAVAHSLADGSPITLLIGPYAAVEANDDSCPSRVRQALFDFIDDALLKKTIGQLPIAAASGALPPLLWQDHLATLCLLSGRTREQIADVTAEAVARATGDQIGPPRGLFKAIADFVDQLRSFQLKVRPGCPAVTIITVCPGLRMERALIACRLEFERATLLIGGNQRPELVHETFEQSSQKARSAAAGDEFFMSDSKSRLQADEPKFVRLVKLAGSRDLDRGVVGGDFAQCYELIVDLRPLLQDFVAPVGLGPYVVLGGGLSTPPVLAAHSVLLRGALEKIASRPCLAVIPPTHRSPDLLRKIEDGPTARLMQVASGGFGRLKIVSAEPQKFINALSVAFGFTARPQAA